MQDIFQHVQIVFALVEANHRQFGAVAPKRKWGPFTFIPKQSIGKVWKISGSAGSISVE